MNGNQTNQEQPKKPSVAGEVAKEAASRGFKAGVKRVGGKVAEKLGLKAIGAAAGGPIGFLAAEGLSRLKRFASKAISGILRAITGEGDRWKQIRNIALGAALLALGLGQPLLAGALGLTALGAQVSISGISGIGSGIAGAGQSIFYGIAAVIAPALGLPILIALIVVPLIIIFIIFIINSGAYVVPQGPPSVSALVESPYIGVEKVARRAGTSDEPQPFLEFENSDLPVTIEYTITVTAKRATLTNINFDWNCTVIRDPDQTCPSYSNVTINGEPAPTILPPAAPSLISPANPFIITYTQLFRSGLFNDSLVIDTFTVTADVESEGVTQTQAAGSATIKVGNPPEQCPSIWPALPQAGEVILNIYQGAYTGSGFSHRALEALDISTTVGHRVYATHTGVVRALYSSCLGNYVEIQSTCGNREFFSRYAHLEGATVRTGESITMGEQLGVSGNTGSCKTGAHLHYEFRYPRGASFSSATGPYPSNPPYMMRFYTPKDVERGCIDEVSSRMCSTFIP